MNSSKNNLLSDKTVPLRRTTASAFSTKAPQTTHIYILVTKPSSGCGNYDGSKGRGQVTLQSNKVPVGRRSGWMNGSTKHRRLLTTDNSDNFIYSTTTIVP